ncbi:Hypothetical protein NTJ_13228 [Nesidiocoris tenuis]|uniref:Uncharacterized protein n=1 Tax=Nesidiocoris tenuis TaxID=355587 RepID=A0ABN7BBB1_9HEMI|nr:Hypothetical protein NTJ_13228 [Nesidiocoris tenuis]
MRAQHLTRVRFGEKPNLDFRVCDPVGFLPKGTFPSLGGKKQTQTTVKCKSASRLYDVIREVGFIKTPRSHGRIVHTKFATSIFSDYESKKRIEI